eukprot:GHVL01026430.1.p1 GENE.GHVL01026430.1~~GHVL01026430.1.p1  ORF type:complete len:373 (+),score=77.66 GHVL01026430.1:16-1134(+)
MINKIIQNLNKYQPDSEASSFGYVIGNVKDETAVLAFISPTPNADDDGVPRGITSSVFTDWAICHLKFLKSFLRGGMEPLGVFIETDEKRLTEFIPLIKKISETANLNQPIIVGSFCNGQFKWKILNNDQFKVVDVKTQPIAQRLIRSRANVFVDLVIPSNSSNILEYIETAIKNYRIIKPPVRIQLMDKTEKSWICETMKEAEQPIGSQKTTSEIVITPLLDAAEASLINLPENSENDCKCVLRFRVAVTLKAFNQRDASTLTVIQALQDDFSSNVMARLNMIWESCEGVFERSSRPTATAVPRGCEIALTGSEPVELIGFCGDGEDMNDTIVYVSSLTGIQTSDMSLLNDGTQETALLVKYNQRSIHRQT